MKNHYHAKYQALRQTLAAITALPDPDPAPHMQQLAQSLRAAAAAFVESTRAAFQVGAKVWLSQANDDSFWDDAVVVSIGSNGYALVRITREDGSDHCTIGVPLAEVGWHIFVEDPS